MISLDQIRSLEKKVYKAVELLSVLQEENKLLKDSVSKYEVRIEELEYLIEEFKDEQSEIEKGIVSALTHLDSLEDAVGGLKQGSIPASGFVENPHIVESTQIAEPLVSGSDFIEDELEQIQVVPMEAEPEAYVENQSDSAIDSPIDEEEDEFKPQDQQLDIF